MHKWSYHLNFTFFLTYITICHIFHKMISNKSIKKSSKQSSSKGVKTKKVNNFSTAKNDTKKIKNEKEAKSKKLKSVKKSNTSPKKPLSNVQLREEDEVQNSMVELDFDSIKPVKKENSEIQITNLEERIGNCPNLGLFVVYCSLYKKFHVLESDSNFYNITNKYHPIKPQIKEEDEEEDKEEENRVNVCLFDRHINFCRHFIGQKEERDNFANGLDFLKKMNSFLFFLLNFDSIDEEIEKTLKEKLNLLAEKQIIKLTSTRFVFNVKEEKDIPEIIYSENENENMCYKLIWMMSNDSAIARDINGKIYKYENGKLEITDEMKLDGAEIVCYELSRQPPPSAES
ncbi:hypothetical protein TRFO_15187 [Tritrichomonas foetus]|uniref:Uncharacterized protein n=1 Tax=Tritrichomonas foetus TaxID=1144522 RepID=A0A1J4KTF1_9EUKA|nr:hypothetical protein TRFO_15187 [Tritrichomonas foetus]|eukprot:OHT14410.1 hypothetical protein TRFO_15187 [Tritrichomonas foetus]